MYPNCPNYVPILLALAVFGIVYNRWVERLERRGHDRGYMGLIVALGCTVTLVGAVIIVGLDPIRWVFACFVASGTPMVVGSISRYCRARARQRQQCLDHNDSTIRR